MIAFVFFLVALLIGLAKGGLGGMLGALATPLLALVMPAEEAVGMLLPVLMYADLFAVSSYWRRWESRPLKLLLPGSVAGVTIGTYFLTNVSGHLLRTTLGVIVLLFTVYKLFEGRVASASDETGRGAWQSRWAGVTSGIASGFSSALAHTGGPPVSIYLLQQGLSPHGFVATAALFFAVLNWVKVPYYVYAGLFDFPRPVLLALAVPAVPLGVWAGRQFVRRVEKAVFDRIIVALLAVAGLLLIFD